MCEYSLRGTVSHPPRGSPACLALWSVLSASLLTTLQGSTPHGVSAMAWAPRHAPLLPLRPRFRRSLAAAPATRSALRSGVRSCPGPLALAVSSACDGHRAVPAGPSLSFCRSSYKCCLPFETLSNHTEIAHTPPRPPRLPITLSPAGRGERPIAPLTLPARKSFQLSIPLAFLFIPALGWEVLFSGFKAPCARNTVTVPAIYFRVAMCQPPHSVQKGHPTRSPGQPLEISRLLPSFRR